MLEQNAALFCSALLQQACYTLSTRARSGKSLRYTALSSAVTNVIWLGVIQQVTKAPDSVIAGASFVAGAVIGSVFMHWVAMRVEAKVRKH